MAEQKGTPKTGGRAKGTPNRVTGLLKDCILRAAQEAGGGGEDGITRYLTQQAVENPTAFMGLLGEVLPTQLTDAADEKLEVVILTSTREEAEAGLPPRPYVPRLTGGSWQA
jgi:hypothetical protein